MMTFSIIFTVKADPDRRIIGEKIYSMRKEKMANLHHEEFLKVAEPLAEGKLTGSIAPCRTFFDRREEKIFNSSSGVAKWLSA